MSDVWRFVGGPQHGRVIENGDLSGTRPVFLLGEPRDENFLDNVLGQLTWNENLCIYSRILAFKEGL